MKKLISILFYEEVYLADAELYEERISKTKILGITSMVVALTAAALDISKPLVITAAIVGLASYIGYVTSK